jgi:hypothetical protein
MQGITLGSDGGWLDLEGTVQALPNPTKVVSGGQTQTHQLLALSSISALFWEIPLQQTRALHSRFAHELLKPCSLQRRWKTLMPLTKNHFYESRRHPAMDMQKQGDEINHLPVPVSSVRWRKPLGLVPFLMPLSYQLSSIAQEQRAGATHHPAVPSRGYLGSSGPDP